LKADYLAARYTAYQAIQGVAPETGQYADTLDYAVYGISPSLLLLAQRASIDLLDKVAAAVTEYLKLSNPSDSVRFTQRWRRFRKGKPVEPPQWQHELAAEIQAGNVGVVALAELVEDLAGGGALDPHQTSRNASTHRFVVLHDEAAPSSALSRFIGHEDYARFEVHTLQSLRIARAAIVYLMLLIRSHESRHRKKRHALRLDVPRHHRIRGEDA
jgi:hypothetical protein